MNLKQIEERFDDTLYDLFMTKKIRERRKECDREFTWWRYRLKNIKVFNHIDEFLFVEGEILEHIAGTPIPDGFEPFIKSGDVQYIIYKGDKNNLI